MNSVQLVGRLTRDPEVRYTEGGSSIARFALAVDQAGSKVRTDQQQISQIVLLLERLRSLLKSIFIKVCGWDARDGPDRIIYQQRWSESVYNRCGCGKL